VTALEELPAQTVWFKRVQMRAAATNAQVAAQDAFYPGQNFPASRLPAKIYAGQVGLQTTGLSYFR
jgi:hypothetical protein